MIRTKPPQNEEEEVGTRLKRQGADLNINFNCNTWEKKSTFRKVELDPNQGKVEDSIEGSKINNYCLSTQALLDLKLFYKFE